MEHWHVEGYYADDFEGNWYPYTFLEAVAEVADRARSFADYYDETARIYAESGDKSYDKSRRGEYRAETDVDQALNALDSYRYAIVYFRDAERMQNVADNAGRFDKYTRGVDISPAFKDADGNLNMDAMLQSARFSVGLETGHNGYTVDIDPLAIYPCNETECEEGREDD